MPPIKKRQLSAKDEPNGVRRAPNTFTNIQKQARDDCDKNLLNIKFDTTKMKKLMENASYDDKYNEAWYTRLQEEIDRVCATHGGVTPSVSACTASNENMADSGKVTAASGDIDKTAFNENMADSGETKHAASDEVMADSGETKNAASDEVMADSGNIDKLTPNEGIAHDGDIEQAAVDEFLANSSEIDQGVSGETKTDKAAPNEATTASGEDKTDKAALNEATAASGEDKTDKAALNEATAASGEDKTDKAAPNEATTASDEDKTDKAAPNEATTASGEDKTDKAAPNEATTASGEGETAIDNDEKDSDDDDQDIKTSSGAEEDSKNKDDDGESDTKPSAWMKNCYICGKEVRKTSTFCPHGEIAGKRHRTCPPKPKPNTSTRGVNSLIAKAWKPKTRKRNDGRRNKKTKT